MSSVGVVLGALGRSVRVALCVPISKLHLWRRFFAQCGGLLNVF